MKKAEMQKRVKTASGGQRGKTLKCSSCKKMRPSREFKPIVVNGKKVIPKTCKLCRVKRTQYYWSKSTRIEFYTIEYECREAREKGIRPPPRSNAHSIPLIEPAPVEEETILHSMDDHSTESIHTVGEGEMPVVAPPSPSSSVHTIEESEDELPFPSDDLLEKFSQSNSTPAIALPEINYSAYWNEPTVEVNSPKLLSRVNSFMNFPSDNARSFLLPSLSSGLCHVSSLNGQPNSYIGSALEDSWNDHGIFGNPFMNDGLYSYDNFSTSMNNTWVY